MIRLVYETHSTTLDNEAGIATGWLPGELSADGRRQAELLGERRRDDGIDAVFSSDLRRAVQTVEIAFAGTDVPRRQDAWQTGWEYDLPAGWQLNSAERPSPRPRP